MRRVRLLLVATFQAIAATGCGQAWQFVSGATPGGPRWLAVLLGAAALLILIVGTFAALWPPPARAAPRGGRSAPVGDH
jgi:hypothetical protein